MEKDIVLVVDDSAIICNIIKDILESPSLHIELAHSGEETIRIASEMHPTIILLDIIMNGIDGYETCRILKHKESTQDIPVIFITGNSASESVLKGFEVGAADYVSKPFIPEELKARVKVHMQNVKNQRKLKLLMEELQEMAITDYLTKLYNRRYLMDRLQIYVNTNDNPISLILFDIDNFKRINDTYGHNAGDKVLVSMAEIFKLILSDEDIISRWGGEEFMICLPNVTSDRAFFIAEKIRNEVCKYEYNCDGETFHCSITGGVIEYNRNISIEKNITNVDKALYNGKSAGKNCVIYSQSL